jgi:hypothetical protein
MDLEALEPIIEQIIKDSLSANVYQYGKNKNLTNRVASGKLRNCVKAKVQPNRQGIQIIQITFLGGKTINQEGVYAYWLANDRGPNKSGKKFANIGAIKEWIKNKKSFRTRDFKTGKFLPKNEKNIERAAFAIARSIGRFGYKNRPQNFVEVSIDKIMKNPKIIEIIGNATMDELINQIEGI